MRRAIGSMAAQWLRKPENREKVKRTARSLYARYRAYSDQRKAGGGSGARARTPADKKPDSSRR